MSTPLSFHWILESRHDQSKIVDFPPSGNSERDEGGMEEEAWKAAVLLRTQEYLQSIQSLFPFPSDLDFSGSFLLTPASSPSRAASKDDCEAPEEMNCCCICSENLEERPRVRTDCDCKGIFYHRKCLNRWFRHQKTCPTCRKIVGKPLAVKIPHRKSAFAYRCDGSTHPRKASFKLLRSALEHAAKKHQVPIQQILPQSWLCRHETCQKRTEETGLRAPLYTEEEILHHIHSEHQIFAIAERA